ncbi:TPA: fimbrial protein, partial [Escherichia coli]
MNKIKGTMFLLLVAGVFSHAAVQKTVFSADVVASTCHVVVEADSSGNSG